MHEQIPASHRVTITSVDIPVLGWAAIFVRMAIGAVPALILLGVVYFIGLVTVLYIYHEVLHIQ